MTKPLHVEDFLFLCLGIAATVVPLAMLVAGVATGQLVANPVFLLAVAVGGLGWIFTAVAAVAHGDAVAGVPPAAVRSDSAIPSTGAGAAEVIERARDAERYFGDLATYTRRRWETFNVIQLLCASAIPVVAAIATADKDHATQWTILTAVLGSVIAVVRGLDGFMQNHETWLRSRGTQQALISARIAYTTRTGAFASAGDHLGDYAARVEEILSGEMQAWITEAKRPPGNAPDTK